MPVQKKKKLVEEEILKEDMPVEEEPTTETEKEEPTSEDKPKEEAKTEPTEEKVEAETGELDLGLDGEPTEEVETIELDMEAAMSKLKPDFHSIVMMMGIAPVASTQEELETALMGKQKEFEQFLSKTLVPKIKAALGLSEAPADKKEQAKQKPGIDGQKTEERKRITTPRQNRK